jgi:peptidyl-prolyl cis-trans isomerase B (cyclophilin B)
MKKIIFLAIFLLAMVVGWSQMAVVQQEKHQKGVAVEMVTSMGRIVLLLYDDTPVHRDNFMKLVESHVYEGTLFHRVIDGFMIQGGDPESRQAKPGQMLGNGTLGYNLPAEFRPHLFHKRGALCAAREGDEVNPKKESSSSQFYIVQGRVWKQEDLDMMEQRFGKKFPPEHRDVYTTLGGAPHLDGDYTVYGEVLEGMDVVDKIASVKRDGFDRPVEDVRIISVKILK